MMRRSLDLGSLILIHPDRKTPMINHCFLLPLFLHVPSSSLWSITPKEEHNVVEVKKQSSYYVRSYF